MFNTVLSVFLRVAIRCQLPAVTMSPISGDRYHSQREKWEVLEQEIIWELSGFIGGFS